MWSGEWEDSLIDYMILEIGVFGIYESISSFASDIDYISSYYFPRNFQQPMVATNVKYTNVEDFRTLYIIEDMAASFQQHISISNINN